MLKKINGIGFQSTLLSHLDGVIHGFSTRSAGDMRNNEARKAFLKRLSLGDALFGMPEQVHGSDVAVVGYADASTKKSEGVDGIVLGKNANGTMGHAFGILVADCVPLLAVDPVAHIIGAAHAGWKGTVGGIAIRLIETMRKEGAKTDRILVSIGPHIGMCCYDVPEERVKAFTQRFGRDEKMAFTVKGVSYMDIGWVNYRQLLAAGVTADHIDAPPTCTSCQNNEFFSYRKDSKETFGEMMAVIGFCI